MTPAQSIAERIREQLKRPGNAVASAGVAAELSSICKKINARLLQIGTVIDNGDEYQAIALAEARPPVIDEVKALQTSDVQKWAIFCEENQLEIPPDLHEKSIQKLSRVYNKGISPNHRLYKEFRDAVLAKRDDLALSIVARIVRLNPGDSNASAELRRLENKLFLTQEKTLGELLKKGREVEILDTLDQIEALGQEDKCVTSQSVQDARKLRKLVNARDGEFEIGQILLLLPDLIDQGQWLNTGEVVARIDKLVTENFLNLSSEQKARLDGAREFFHKNRDEALRRADFASKVRELETLTLDAENLSQARGTLNLAEARARLLALNRQWQIVEGYTLPVDPVLVQRVSRIAGFLKTEISRLLRRKRITLGTTALLGTAFLGGTAFLLLIMFRASDIEKQLGKAMGDRSVDVVSKLIESTKKDHPKEAGTPSLAAAIQRAETWLKNQNRDFDRFNTEVVGLEQALKEPGSSLASIKDRAEQLRSEFGFLPKQYQEESKEKLDAVTSSCEQWMEKTLANIESKVSSELDNAEKEVLPNLSLTKTPEDLGESVQRAGALLAAWKSAVEGLPSSFSFSATTLDRINALKSAFNMASDALSEHRRMVKQLEEAKTFEDYQTAIFALKGTALVGSPLVEAAAIASLTKISAAQISEQMVFPSDPIGWKEAQKGPEGLQLKPESIVQAELRTLGPVLKGDKVRDVYTATVQGKSVGTVYSYPTALQMIDLGIEDRNGKKLKKWIGPVYNPKDGVPVVFMRREYSNADYTMPDERVSDVVGIGKSSVFEAFLNMKTDAFIAGDGAILRPVMGVIDDLLNTPQVDPAYAGYVLNTLFEATKLRQYAWGLQFSPDCKDLLTDVHTQLDQDHINVGDWLAEDRRKSIAQKLSGIFAERKKISYAKQAKLRQSLVEFVVKNPMEFVGFVGPDGMPVLANQFDPPSMIWGLTGKASTAVPAALYRRLPDRDVAKYEQIAKGERLTPLFSFKVDPAKAVIAGLKAVGITPEEANLYLPTMFQPLAANSTPTAN